jgi:hypothetical protein
MIRVQSAYLCRMLTRPVRTDGFLDMLQGPTAGFAQNRSDHQLS